MEEQVAKRESPFKIIYGFAEEKRGKLTLATVLAVFGALCGIVPYLAVASLLQHALTGSLDVRAALGLAALAVLGYVFQKGLSARATLSAHEAAYEIIAHVRVRMLQKLSRVSMGTVQARSSGAYKQLIIDDAERLEIPLAHIIPEVTAAIATPLFVLAYLVIIDWRMALAALASGILGLAVYYCMMFGRNKMMQDYLASNMHMNATIVEYVNGIEVVRAFGQSASRMERLKDAVFRVRDITTKWYAHCWPFMSAGQAIMPQTIVFVLPVGMALYADGIVSLDETILCMLLAMAIVSSLQTMMEFMENLSIVMEVVPQVQAVLALPELPFTSESQRPQPSDVVLEDVHFSYEGWARNHPWRLIDSAGRQRDSARWSVRKRQIDSGAAHRPLLGRGTGGGEDRRCGCAPDEPGCAERPDQLRFSGEFSFQPQLARKHSHRSSNRDRRRSGMGGDAGWLRQLHCTLSGRL